MPRTSVLTWTVTLLSSKGLFCFGWPARRAHGVLRGNCHVYVSKPCHSRWLHNEANNRGQTRQRVFAKFLDDGATTDDPRERAREAFSKLARRGKSWKRLCHLVDLACLCNVRSIADVGCDHGLLSLGLAMSNRFESIVGVDLSEQALSNGALSLYEKVLEDVKNDERWYSLSPEQVMNLFPVDFCVGDGLRVLQHGQADALCIAGMGVDAMIRILDPTELNRVGCQFLILQPTNSRPRNLIRLYDRLADTGWAVTNERIEYLSSRWYISSLFAKETVLTIASSRENTIPGQLLTLSEETSTSMRDAHGSYIRHHQRWIEQDSRNGGAVDDNDCRWLEVVDKYNVDK